MKLFKCAFIKFMCSRKSHFYGLKRQILKIFIKKVFRACFDLSTKNCLKGSLKLLELQFFKYNVKLCLESLRLDSPKLYVFTVAIVSMDDQNRALCLSPEYNLGWGASSSMHTPSTTFHTFLVISLANENIQMCFY